MPGDGHQDGTGRTARPLRDARGVPWRQGCRLMEAFGYRFECAFGSTALFIGVNHSDQRMLPYTEGWFGQRCFSRSALARELIAIQRASGRRKLLTIDELEAAAARGPLNDAC